VDVAVKAFKDVKFIKSVKLLKAIKSKEEKFCCEGEMMLSLRHPNITQLLGACSPNDDSSDPPLLIFEYLETGSLSHYLHEVSCHPDVSQRNEESVPGGLDTHTAVSIAIDICLALVYLHSRKIAHLDVKSDNVFLDAYLRAKLGDLGLARRIDPFQTESASFCLTGTPAFMAPEALRGAKVTTSADAYGFALVAWEMVAGEKPFMGMTVAEVCTAVVGGDRPKIPPQQEKLLGEVITACWHPTASSRPPMAQVLQSLKNLTLSSVDPRVDDALTVPTPPPPAPPPPKAAEVVRVNPPQQDKRDITSTTIPFCPTDDDLQNERNLLRRQPTSSSEDDTKMSAPTTNAGGLLREALYRRRGQMRQNDEEEEDSSVDCNTDSNSSLLWK